MCGPRARAVSACSVGSALSGLSSLAVFARVPGIGTAKRSSDGGPAKLVVGGFAPHTPLLVAQLQRWLRWGRGPGGGTMLVA